MKLVTGNPVNNKDNTVYLPFNKGKHSVILFATAGVDTSFSISTDLPNFKAKVIHVVHEFTQSPNNSDVYLSNEVLPALPTVGGAFTTSNAFMLINPAGIYISLDPTTDDTLHFFPVTASTRILINFYDN